MIRSGEGDLSFVYGSVRQGVSTKVLPLSALGVVTLIFFSSGIEHFVGRH